MSIKRLAIGAVALVALMSMAGAAGAGSYTTGFESFNLGTVDGQEGWHSAVPGDIPALPNGYDQAVVDTSVFGSPAGFATKSLRVSNAYTEPSGEFFFQTYSPSVTDPAGETQTNHVFDGTFQFTSTSVSEQPGLFVSVSPDNGVGARMSYVSLDDTAAGIQMTFYETDATGNFVGHDVGTYSRDGVHTVRFLIETVPGEANDVLSLYVDGVDIGDRDGLCFTTWEQYYREGEGHEPGVINSFEFRTAGDGATIPGLIGGGYLFDNVTTEARATGGPVNGCGGPTTATLNVKKFYDADLNGTQTATAPTITGWKVQVANGSTQVGTTPFTASGLAPGDYTASEFSPNEPNWYPTTPTSVDVTLAAGDDETVSFGNVCTGPGGGMTIGFWGNKNGQALFGADDLAMLVALSLRNADGSAFDPATYAAFKAWLSKATAKNMAYMLSAQLAAMALNVFNGKVDGSALVYAPDVNGANSAGFITVDDLMTEANAALGADGFTPSGDANRNYQEVLKNALDRANNNMSFAQSAPCEFSFPEPICDAGTGAADAAYNAIPTDVEHCSPPSLGFEANQVAEFGDRVLLDTTAGTELVSMTVDFQSYGCSVSGHWNTADCVTTAGSTFTVPGGITAKIYDAATLTPLATSDVLNPSIPFRPSAISDASCPNPPGSNPVDSRFKDPVSGQCNYSLSVPLTFTFPAGTTFVNGQDVVWTVQFNTTHYGYSPIGEAAPCFASAPGCGYDSLNVGAKSYPGAPYAGTDVNEDVVYLSTGGSLATDTGWTGFRPLGQIVTGP